MTISEVLVEFDPGESLSRPTDCKGGSAIRIYTPNEWTADAVLSFALSFDGKQFYDFFDVNGYEVVRSFITNAVLPVEQLGHGLKYVKFRSGSRVKPIAQEAHRSFRLALEK